jgi:hypothetical protein
MNKQKLIGYYNKFGYAISNIINNEVYYTAGNSKLDSYHIVNPKSELACNIKTIKKFCKITLADICKEYNAINLGIKYKKII